MLSLPLIAPRDSHELWFGPSQHSHLPQPTSSNNPLQQPRRTNNAPPTPLNGRALVTSAAPANGLSALVLEERALRARKANIASFGYSWLKPAGVSKTMLGIREEDAEREEAMAAVAAEYAAAASTNAPTPVPAPAENADQLNAQQGEEQNVMERDLDDSIPEAGGAGEGLVEEGEEDLEEGYGDDEEAEFMGRDLDDDIPDGYPPSDDGYGDDDDDDEDDSVQAEDDDFDDQPGLDNDIPEPGDEHGEAEEAEEDEEDEEEEGGGEGDEEVHDLDNDIPEAAGLVSEDEWQHTDSDAEIDDDDENANNTFSSSRGPFSSSSRRLRTSAFNNFSLPRPSPQQLQQQRQQRRPPGSMNRSFLSRFSAGADALNSSAMMLDEDDLRSSVNSTGSRPSPSSRGGGRVAGLRRMPPHYGGPRDSLG